jgi:hypothetical protein
MHLQSQPIQHLEDQSCGLLLRASSQIVQRSKALLPTNLQGCLLEATAPSEERVKNSSPIRVESPRQVQERDQICSNKSLLIAK